VVLIDHGRVVVGGPIREVKRSTGRQVVRIAVDGDGSMPWLAEVPGVRVVRPGLDYTELDVEAGIDPESVLRAALDHKGVRVTQFLIGDPSIEEIFIEKVGRRPTEVQHLGATGVAR
jgi:ABC-2 type transport system ATP-binding protein